LTLTTIAGKRIFSKNFVKAVKNNERAIRLVILGRDILRAVIKCVFIKYMIFKQVAAIPG
jgi:hypothetical protein